MKKKVLKLTFLLSTVAFIFSSCLGDGDNKIDVSKDFVFITEDNNGTKVAATWQAGYGSAQELQGLEKGTCLWMGYKIIGTQSGSYSNLEEINIQKTFLPQNQAPVRIMMPPAGTDSEEIYPNSLTVSVWTSGNYAGDRWLFTPNCALVDGEKITAVFYYDAAANVDGEGKPLKNRAIIDVRFYRTSPGMTGETPINKNEELVANFEDLRTELKNRIDFEGQNEAYYFLKFRFRKSKEEAPYYEDATIGDYSPDSSSGYRLGFINE